MAWIKQSSQSGDTLLENGEISPSGWEQVFATIEGVQVSWDHHGLTGWLVWHKQWQLVCEIFVSELFLFCRLNVIKVGSGFVLNLSVNYFESLFCTLTFSQEALLERAANLFPPFFSLHSLSSQTFFLSRKCYYDTVFINKYCGRVFSQDWMVCYFCH